MGSIIHMGLKKILGVLKPREAFQIYTRHPELVVGMAGKILEL